jgi:hypothetical protein
VEPVVRQFDSYAEAEAADRAYYRSLRPNNGWRFYSIWSSAIARNMAVPKGLREFIESLNSHGVEYLVVGAHGEHKTPPT